MSLDPQARPGNRNASGRAASARPTVLSPIERHRRALASEFRGYRKFINWGGNGARPMLGRMSVTADEHAPDSSKPFRADFGEGRSAWYATVAGARTAVETANRLEQDHAYFARLAAQSR
jgi:hypothetical protein